MCSIPSMPVKSSGYFGVNCSVHDHFSVKDEVNAAIKESILARCGVTKTGRYVVTGTLLTDGHQLKIHTYSLVHPKKKNEDKGVVSDDGIQSSASCSTNPPRSMNHSTKFKMKCQPAAAPNPKALKKEFDDQESHVVLAIDPGINNTATDVVAD
ncbi:hypothetical protein BGZ58_008583 [Dissophora ornata]|nr:hypothetical protein BGZ58_008583 [Dissophora ornata]